jgi:hypothetical protein
MLPAQPTNPFPTTPLKPAGVAASAGTVAALTTAVKSSAMVAGAAPPVEPSAEPRDAGQDAPERSPDTSAEQTSADGDRASLASIDSGEALSEDERAQLEKLEKRDRKVRTHEQAHVAAAGELYRSGPHYTYQTGPDGKRYAVGGSVSIDTSPVPDDPAATIRKAAKIRAAALAPADPSPTDRSIAQKAQRMSSEAQRELAERRRADSAASASELVTEPEPEPASTSSSESAGASSSETDRRIEPTSARDIERAGARGRYAFSVSRLGDMIPTPLKKSLQDAMTGELQKPTDDLLSKPTDDLMSKPTDDLMSKPTDDLMTDTLRVPRLGLLYG